MPINMSQLNNDASASEQPAVEKSDLRKMLEKNLELTEQVLILTKRLDHFRKWQQALGVIKLLLIIVPLVLGIIYLPALLDKALAPYNELLNLGGENTESSGSVWDLLNSLRGL